MPSSRGDFPIPDQPPPRFLDDAAATMLLVAGRGDADLFVRVAVEFLARTGLGKGGFLDLRADAVVQIGSAYWLRVPVGKLHNDRFIPLHPQLKAFIDQWLARRPEGLRLDLLFVERGRRLWVARVDRAVAKVANTAGIGHVSPHQLRHTLATQAINRGMSLEVIAALLGHRALRMTMVHARVVRSLALAVQKSAVASRPVSGSSNGGRLVAGVVREQRTRGVGARAAPWPRTRRSSSRSGQPGPLLLCGGRRRAQ